MSTKVTGDIAVDIGWGIAVAVTVGAVSGIVWFMSELVNMSF